MKKANKEKYSRRVFIFIEILIVMISISILAFIMIFSSNESMNSTKASKIANNLRTLKTVAFEQYMNNIDDRRINNILSLDKYINSEKISSGEFLSAGCYGIYDAENSYFVGYKFADNEGAIKNKLKARANTLGLKFSDNHPESGMGDSVVWLKVM